MYEALAILQTYTRIVWRFRWVSLVFAAAACLCGWVVVLLLPNQFEVTATVYLDTQTLLRPLLKGIAVDSTIEEDTASIMRQTLLVRPNLETVIRKTDMDLKAETPEAFERMMNQLATSIKISGTSRDNIFEIAYMNEDAKLATRVVDALLNLFVERSLGKNRKDTSTSKEFLATQIKEYEARLITAENRLKEFKRQNVGLMPGEGKTYYAKLEEVHALIAEANLELQEAENRRSAIEQQLGSVSALLGSQPELVQHPLDERIAGLEELLDRLLLQFTDKHPDVIANRSILERLRAQREEELAANPAGEEAEFAENPIYQELKVGLTAVESEIAALQVRVKEYQARDEQLRKLVDTIPKVEAELAKLNRDYELDHENYDELVKRREALSISDQASQTSDEVQFNIIEPPLEPVVPAAPNRPLLNAAVLIVGFGAGIGIALALGLLRPAIYSKEAFGEFTDLPVLGSVSRIWTRGELLRRRMELATYAVGCVCLLAVYGGLVLVEALDFDLVAHVATFKERLV